VVEQPEDSTAVVTAVDFGKRRSTKERQLDPPMEQARRTLQTLRRLLARVGPYVLIELLLPGGTLVALLLYLHSRREEKPTTPRVQSES
jgi:hypothetical protein